MWFVLLVCCQLEAAISASTSHIENSIDLETIIILKNELTSMKDEIKALQEDNKVLKGEVKGLQTLTQDLLEKESKRSDKIKALETDKNILQDEVELFRKILRLGGEGGVDVPLDADVTSVDGPVDDDENKTIFDSGRDVKLHHNTANKKRLLFDEQSMEQGVAFSTTLTQFQLQNLGQGQTVVFNKVISNYGNCYDDSVGIFKVPISGLYVFSLTVMSDPNETQELDVVVNGNQIFHCYADGNEYNTASRTIVTHVETGDNVWVRTANWQHSDKLHGAEHSSFTGFLLYPD